ncbi:MAG: protein-disulfide reductase DsbD family protein [Ancalomicrobiaceae bacterium]|nr:protein-disulfide reductase DsbD family protein [Ancalomicrobiaceae bacterium]
MRSIGRLSTISGLALAAVWVAPPLQAQDRAEAMGTTIRLIVGERHGPSVAAGLAIDLEPGWKTYWRYPGDSGVPPTLDTAGSVNVAAFTLEFPAPERFRDGSDQTIGYHRPVTLPLTITLADPAKPAELRIKAQFGVCRDICVPVDVSLDRRIDPAMPPDAGEAAEIAAAETAVPAPAKAGEPFSVVKLHCDEAAKPPVVTVAIKAPPKELKDIFVEGPEGWALPLPDRVATAGDVTTWRFVLDGLPSGAKHEGAPLTFTIVGGDRATTQTVTLD